MKTFILTALMLFFSMNASAWTTGYSTWYKNYSSSYHNYSTWQKTTNTYCSTKPQTIQTACDLKSYAGSTAGSAAFSFFQGYVVSAFRNQQPVSALCSYTGTDQQAVAAAIDYLNKLTAQQCPSIKAEDALDKAFESANLITCL